MNNDLPSLILKTAWEKFGIFTLKPYQLLVIQRILEQDTGLYEKRNQLVILPTGTGKSLCFQLPATLCKGKTVIVYPLLALMNDQIHKLKSLGIDCVCLRGGQTASQRSEVYKSLRNGTKIIITNPETLCQQSVLKAIARFKISLFVCDEAHVISQWGKDFRPSYTKLHDILPVLKPNQIIAFTATAGKQTVNDIESCLFTHKPLIVRGDADRENIYYKAIPVNERTYSIVRILGNCQFPAIVFCPTRALTYNLCRLSKLAYHEIPMRYYHAGLSKTEREAIEKWFLESNNGILFATNAYGMGIDKQNIRTVIHHTLPLTVEAFLQESGRAGRDGKQSYSYVLIDESDKTGDRIVNQIFTSYTCRRSALLSVLGQKKEECSGCDVCDHDVLTEPVENKIIINAVRKNPFKYTRPLLRSLLCGNKNTAFVPVSFRFDQNFGKLSDFNEDEIAVSIKALCGKNKPLHELKKGKKAPLLFFWVKKRTS